MNRQLATLLLTNSVLLIGPIFFGTTFIQVIYAYWFELIGVSLFHLPRLYLVITNQEKRQQVLSGKSSFTFQELALLVVVGLTPLLMLIKLGQTFATDFGTTDIFSTVSIFALLGLLLNRAYQFKTDFLDKKQYLHNSFQKQLASVLLPVLFMAVTFSMVGLAYKTFQPPELLLILPLVGMKILIDLGFYYFE